MNAGYLEAGGAVIGCGDDPYLNIRCGCCGVESNVEAWLFSSKLKIPLGHGVFQCPACGVALERRVNRKTGAVKVLEVGGVL